MSVKLSTYTNSVIEKDMLATSSEIKETRRNLQEGLTALQSHIGKAGDVHGVVTSSEPGFAPSDIYNTLNEYEKQLKQLESAMEVNQFPEGSIIVWAGSCTDTLPTGWRLCDGSTYTDSSGTTIKLPDLRYRIPVTVTSSRPYKSIATSIGRSNSSSAGSVSDIGRGITKNYIIRVPTVAKEEDNVTLTVVQPINIRIATNYSENNETILRSWEDGTTKTYEVPRGSKIVVSGLEDLTEKYTIISYNISTITTTTTISANSFTITDNTTVTANLNIEKAEITLIQPIDCRISTTVKSEYLAVDADLRLLPDGSTETFTTDTKNAITFSIFGGLANILKYIVVKDKNGTEISRTSVNIKPYNWGIVTILPKDDCTITGEIELYPYTGIVYQSGSSLNSDFISRSNGIYDAHTGVWATSGKYITMRIPGNITQVLAKFMYPHYRDDESWSSGALGNNSTGTNNWWQSEDLSPQIERVIKVTPGALYKICFVCGGGSHSSGRAYGDGIIFGSDIQKLTNHAEDYNHLSE